MDICGWFGNPIGPLSIDGGFNQDPQSRHLMMYGAMEWSSAVRKL
jgi:hypothetical protein